MSLNVKYAKLLYEDVLNDVTKSPDEWISFLKTSSWIFEYTFSEQLLIYAQRSDAKAVATMEFWNKNFHRWIKKGSKAIRIIKYENGTSYMQNLFDVSDTYQNYGYFKGLWNLDLKRDKEDFIETLESKYGELENKESIESGIESAIINLVEDNINAYYEENPLLNHSEQEYKDLFKELVKDSVIFVVNNRIGIPNDEYTYKMYFEKIDFIGDPDIISIFGNAIRDLSRDVIREARTFVKNRTLAIYKNKEYAKQKLGGVENERSENKLYSSERLSDTRSRSDGESKESEWQIRNSERELFDRTQTISNGQNDSNRNINTSFESSTAGMRRTTTITNGTKDKEGQLNGTNEGTRPNEVDTNDELNQNGSGTGIDERVSAGITDDVLTETEQINLIENLIQDEIKEKTVDNDLDNHNLQSFFDENSKVVKENQELLQYTLPNEEQNFGGAKERYKNNINAIKLLKKLEDENRLAIAEEQEILSKYVGWGGLANAFDDSKEDWKNEYIELKELLNETEYRNARASSRTAFYTPPLVISSMYDAIKNMGFTRGNILEPSCGIGNFIGSIPDEIKNSNFYGVELDGLSGRIAKQLYQKSTIMIQGFEETDLQDNSFDVAIGNVPFDDFVPTDKRYDKYHFQIHDYFFAKSIDKVRAGGVIAFITSKGTMDKANSSFRKYISQRADLIGAIRLPNDTFSRNAGTKTTTDIIFLQKREVPNYEEPEWINLGTTEDGITMNQYFIDNPQMVLGKMEMKSTQYGRMDSTCTPFENSNLKELLGNAIQNLNAQIPEIEVDEITSNLKDNVLPADLNSRNYSFINHNGKIYYRENSKMYLQDLPDGTIKRIKKLIDIRDTTRKLIEEQTNDEPDEVIKGTQNTLNFMYDNFIVNFGRINSRANRKAFEDDASFYLLSSLEINDDKGNFLRKADMFTKRTIKPHKEITSVQNAEDALIVSISEKAKVDLDYMSSLSKLSKEKIIEELQGVIFKVPYLNEYQTADEYLSGNVREKLEIAKNALEQDDSLNINVRYLENVIPEDLQASEIAAKLGVTWIPVKYIQQFMIETFGVPYHLRNYITISYSDFTSNWNITGKTYDSSNVKVINTYGTKRMNAYKILENTLNMKDVKVFDTIEDEEGNEKRVLNKKETAIATSKQDLIKEEFEGWLWKDIDRREELVRLYNDKFNSIRPREYDGSHIKFDGINPDITLRKHQVNAIAHILYGGNTLLAHEVGAGKTFEMVASCMESKRLNLSNKALFVVPNHIIEQFATEFLQLYPSANILVSTKKDFSTNYRKRFCSKIATGEYDAIIIGHSQFEKIPISPERQKRLLQDQLDELVEGIEEAKVQNAERFTIKELERTKRHLEERLKKLNDQSRKDDVIYFEELGTDKMFVDEAHNFKNCARRCHIR